MPPTSKKVLAHHLSLMGINRNVMASLRYVEPFIESCMDDIVERFYAYMQSLPEGRKVFSDPAFVAHLKKLQRMHWMLMFKGKLGEDFQQRCYHIGSGHHKKGIAPHLYLCGYNFFQCEMIRVVSEKYRHDSRLAEILDAITRVISLDMDLALSVYMREMWRNKADTLSI